MELFEEYKNNPDKAVRERANNWGAAIGLQDVDGLNVSEFLIQLARLQIEGEITMEEVTQRLNDYYGHNKQHSSTYEIVTKNHRKNSTIFTYDLPNLDLFYAIWQIIIDFCIIFAVAKSKSYDNRQKRRTADITISSSIGKLGVRCVIWSQACG